MNERNKFFYTENTVTADSGLSEDNTAVSVEDVATGVYSTAEPVRTATTGNDTADIDSDGNANDSALSDSGSDTVGVSGQTESDTATEEVGENGEIKTGLEAETVTATTDYTEQLILISESLAATNETLNSIYGITVMIFMFLLLSWTERRIHSAVTNFTNSRKR